MEILQEVQKYDIGSENHLHQFVGQGKEQGRWAADLPRVW